MSGKGDKPRPMSVSRDEFRRLWDEVFRPKLVVEQVAPSDEVPQVDKGGNELLAIVNLGEGR